MVAADFTGSVFASASTGHGTDLLRSNDRGETWNISLPAYTINHMSFRANGDIFACTSCPFNIGNVLRSTDNALTWILLPRPGICPTMSVFYPNGDIFIGDSGALDILDGGVYRSTDNGNTWLQTNFPDSVGVFSMVISSKGDILAGTQKGIYRSTDSSNNWTLVNNGIREDDKHHIFWWIVINPVNDYIYAATYNSIYQSTDKGNSWSLTNLQVYPSDIFSLVINSKGYIFVAIVKSNIPESKSGIFYSPDNGINWKEINNGLTNEKVFSLAIDNLDFLYAATKEGLFRTKYSTR